MRVLLALLFIAGFSVTPGVIPAAQDEQPIQLDVSVGFDGYFRNSAWVPVFVSLSNEGPNIDGYLRVRVLGGLSGNRASLFSTPVELPNQSRKQVTLFIIADDYSEGLIVELFNGDELVAQSKQTLVRLQPPDALYAVVSDSPVWGANLERVRPFIGNAFQVNIPLELVPAHANALSALDAMLLVDVDTGPDRLSEEQHQAILDWVLGGGHLIVAGGADWQRTTAGLADMLPVEVDGAFTVDDLSPLETYIGRYGDTGINDTPTLVATGSLAPDAAALFTLPSAEGDIPLIARRRHGLGTIDYLAASPTAEPLASWPNAGELWATLLTSVDQRPSWAFGFGQNADSWSSAQEATEIIPMRLPAPQFICGFLAIYMILIGPLNYLLLKRLKRRELAWITIPAAVVLFTVLAYISGVGLRGSSAIMTRLNVVQVWHDAGRSRVDGLIGVWSPFRTTYTLTMPEGYSVHPLPGSSLVGAGLGIEIEQSTHYTAHDVQVNIGSVRSFVTQGYTDDAPNIEASATMRLPASEAGEIIISGRLTNASDLTLTDAVLLARGATYPLSELAPGAEKTFSLTLSREYLREEAYSAVPAALARDFVFDIGGQQRAGGTANDVMQTDYISSFGKVYLSQDREIKRRQLFVRGLVHDLEPTGGRGDNVYLMAWADGSPIDATLDREDYTVVDRTLYIFQIPLDVQPSGEMVYIGPEQMSWTLAADSALYEVNPLEGLAYRRSNYFITQGQELAPDEFVSFRFTPLPGVRPTQVSALSVDVEANYVALRPSLGLWNWDTGAWEMIEAGWGKNEIYNPARYIGPEGAVKVMLYNNSPQSTLHLSHLQVSMRGRL